MTTFTEFVQEQRELYKNNIIEYIDESIKITKKQLKSSIEDCDKNYFSGSLDTLAELKNYIKNL